MGMKGRERNLAFAFWTRYKMVWGDFLAVEKGDAWISAFRAGKVVNNGRREKLLADTPCARKPLFKR